MGSEIPQPADDEFEARLTWTPEGERIERATERGVSRRQRQAGRTGPASPERSGSDTDARTDDADVRAQLTALRDEVRAVRDELEVVRVLFEELLGEDPAAAVADPERTGTGRGATMRLRLRGRSAPS